MLSSVLVVAALGALVGCSSGDKKETAASTTVPVATTSAPRTFTGEGSEDFCVIARANIDKLQQVPTAISSPEQLQALLAEVAPEVRRAVSVAPAEIKSTVSVLADGFEKLLAGDYTVLSDPTFSAAGTELQAYGKQVCGIS